MAPFITPFELRPYDADSSFLVTGDGRTLRVNAPCTPELQNTLNEHTQSDSFIGVAKAYNVGDYADREVAVALRDRAKVLTAATTDIPTTRDGGFIVVGDRRIRRGVYAALQKIDRSNLIRDCGDDIIIGANLARPHHTLVICRDRAINDRDVALCRHAEDLRVPYLIVSRIADRLWIGPRHDAPAHARARDVHLRRIAAAHDANVAHALSAPAVLGSAWPDEDCLHDAIISGLDLAFDVPPYFGIHELRRNGELTFHPLLPLTESGALRSHAYEASFPADARFLIDSQTGIIKAEHPVKHRPPTPASLTTHQARVSQLSAIADGMNSIFCQGSTLDDAPKAKNGSIGESIERYCGNRIDAAHPIQGTWRSLTDRGLSAVHPDDFVLFADEQYSAPGFPFHKFTEETLAHWIWGRDLSTNDAVLVPAQTAYVNWHAGPYACDVPIMPQAFAGIAAGSSAQMAIVGALREVFERHATMVWWLSGHPIAKLPEVDLPAGDGQRIIAMPIPNTLNTTVMAVVIHDDDRDLVNIGFSCNDSPTEALRKAWTEAQTLQEGSRDLLNPDNLHFKSIDAGLLPPSSLKPHRKDRRYLDDFRNDFRDVDSLFAQQQIYLDPRTRVMMSHLLDPQATLNNDDLPSGASSPVPPEEWLRRSLQTLEERGLHAIDVDLTTTDAAIAGFHVHRVVVPGLVGNSSAAFPLLGKNVVSDESIRLGWTTEPLDHGSFNVVPMPHA